MAPQLPLVRPFQPLDSCITSNFCNPQARDTPRHMSFLKELEGLYEIPDLGLDLNATNNCFIFSNHSSNQLLTRLTADIRPLT